MTDCAGSTLTWAEVDALRHTAPPPPRASDGAVLPCAALCFERCAPRAAAALFDAVLPVAPRALLPRGPRAAAVACCAMRDTGAVRAAVAVGAALLCVRTGARRVELAALAVRAAYRGHRAVAAHLVAYAAAQHVVRPGDTLAVHVQADNAAALAFYVRTLAMRPAAVVSARPPQEQPREAKRARTDIGTLAAEAAAALGVDAQALAQCAVEDYYPPRPACRFGSRHAFVLAVRVPDDPLQLPWAPSEEEGDDDEQE